jgi:DNA polymerase
MSELETENDAWRQLRSYLESLKRAGLVDLPVGEWSGEVAAGMALEDSQARSVPDVTELPSDRVFERPRETAEPKTAKHEPILKNQYGPKSDQGQKTNSEQRSSEYLIPGVKPPEVPVRRTPQPDASRHYHSITSMFDKNRKMYDSPVIPADKRLPILNQMSEEVAACTRCAHLAATRTQTVFSDGDCNARLMFIGEAPGADEDQQGKPFVGRAGQLLTDMITRGMGLDRQSVYIANVLKCRPPENRTPVESEMENCFGFLDRQIEIVRPEYICLLGKTAVTAILQTALPMKNLRLRWHRYKDIPVMVTYHPAYLLRNPPAKKDTWDDLKFLMAEMGLKPPG